MPECVSNVNQPKRKIKLETKSSKAGLFWPLAIIVIVALVDQASKIWAVSSLLPGESVEVLGRFFMFTLVYNEGGALGTNFGSSSYYLISALIILALVIVYIYANRKNTAITLPLAFIAGGAAGNIVDRLRFGSVVDFLDFDFFDFIVTRWYTFNIADAAITCSIVYLGLYLLLGRKEIKQTENASQGAEQPDYR